MLLGSVKQASGPALASPQPAPLTGLNGSPPPNTQTSPHLLANESAIKIKKSELRLCCDMLMQQVWQPYSHQFNHIKHITSSPNRISFRELNLHTYPISLFESDCGNSFSLNYTLFPYSRHTRSKRRMTLSPKSRRQRH